MKLDFYDYINIANTPIGDDEHEIDFEKLSSMLDGYYDDYIKNNDGVLYFDDYINNSPNVDDDNFICCINAERPSYPDMDALNGFIYDYCIRHEYVPSAGGELCPHSIEKDPHEGHCDECNFFLMCFPEVQ